MTRVEEHAAKVDRVRHWLREGGHGAALFATQNGFAWITAGGEAHVGTGEAAAVGAVLVTPARVILLTNTIEAARLREEELDDLALPTEIWPWSEHGGLENAVRRLVGGTGVATDGPGPFSLEPDLVALRYTLLSSEVERYRALGQQAANLVERIAREITPGQSERDVAGLIAGRAAAHGVLAVTNLVAADDRIARYRHPLPTSRPLRERAMLVLTGRRQGLHVSLTRLVSFSPVDPDTRHRHEAVTAIDAALIDGSRPGRTLAAVLADGLRRYAETGFPGEWKHHHQGGLTGYGGREVFATPVATHRLTAHQGLAWNPSVTGTKSEDTILVTEAGVEILTATGSWPTVPVKTDRSVLLRPDILIR